MTARRINSKRKGKRGELEVAAIFKDYGLDAHRTAQVDGTLSADVVVEEHPELHVEVKLNKRIAAMRFMDQAQGDAAADARGGTPARAVVFMREDLGGWMVMLPAEDYMDLLTNQR